MGLSGVVDFLFVIESAHLTDPGPGVMPCQSGLSPSTLAQYRQAAGAVAQIKSPDIATFAGAKRRDTDRSACMKNRHRVSQVVSKLIYSRADGAR